MTKPAGTDDDWGELGNAMPESGVHVRLGLRAGEVLEAPKTVVLPRETLRLFEAAKAWLEKHNGGVHRTATPWGEHVAVFLPTGVSAQFTVKEPGDFEEGIVLAVDEIRG